MDKSISQGANLFLSIPSGGCKNENLIQEEPILLIAEQLSMHIVVDQMKANR